MELTQRLREIADRQRQAICALEDECKTLESGDLLKENDRLSDRLAVLEAETLGATKRLEAAEEENKSLKNALYQQMYGERMTLLRSSQQRLESYFKAETEGEINRLTALENSFRKRIDLMTSELGRAGVDIRDELFSRLGELQILVNQRITHAKAQLNRETGVFSQDEQQQFEQLKAEQLTDRMMKEQAGKNNIERLVGLNLINKLGMLLIVAGVIVASQYSFLKLSDLLKGIFLYLLGGALLGGGEWLSRKKSNVFSLGLSAGGVAVLFIATATGYFLLDILGVYAALGLCVLITAVAFVLSIRYNAQVIAAFALIGGYLPMLSLQGDRAMLYGAMAYFILLNLFALLLSFRRKWMVSAYLGLALNIAGSFFIVFSGWENGVHGMIAACYLLFAFLSYTLIPVVGSHRGGVPLKTVDLVLIGINTFFSSLLIYLTFLLFGYQDYSGLLAVLFAACYLGLGRLSEGRFASGKNATALFYLTGLVFVVLVIPFQFGRAWLTLGWLAEGVALAAYGILREEKSFRRAGFVICGLCLAAFVFFDIFGGMPLLFGWKYFAITAGSLVLLGCLIYKRTLAEASQKAFKYFVYLNLWFYSLYLIGDTLSGLLERGLQGSLWDTGYLCGALAVVVTLLLAYTVPRIKLLCDNGMKIISAVLYLLGIFRLFWLNSFRSPLQRGAIFSAEVPLSYTLIGTLILLLLSLLSVFALYDLMKAVVLERKMGVEWFPLAVSGYFVVILTQNLIAQYRLQFSSAVLSIIYVLTALAWIVLGFAKRYAFLRRFGLGLSVLAVAKLFLIDLTGLTKGYQIVSYLSLGITLVAISFVYQYFNKRLELKAEVMKDVEASE